MLNKVLYRLYRRIKPLPENAWFTSEYVDLFNAEANRYIRKTLSNSDGGLMLTKPGSYELEMAVLLRGVETVEDIKALPQEHQIKIYQNFENIYNNAGVFPHDIRIAIEYKNLFLRDIEQADIICSYVKGEGLIEDLTQKARKVNMKGFCNPFEYKNPWSEMLRDKKVLVINPFVDSIRSQYEKNRSKLWNSPDVLPQFKSLSTIKAVQSIAGNGESTGYKDWFEALESMKAEMNATDYDIAIIGCGAYGMHLAAHAKRSGKIGIHNGSMTQFLFGVYGRRWVEHQPELSKYINEYWVRPSEQEKPKNFNKVENGCYW